MAPEGSLKDAAALLRHILEDVGRTPGHSEATLHSMLAMHKALSSLPETNDWFNWLTDEVVKKSPVLKEYAIRHGAIDARVVTENLPVRSTDFQAVELEDPCLEI